MTTKYIDYLSEDTVIPGQRFYTASFVSPEGIKNCSLRALKIRGVYPDAESAKAHAAKLREDDPDFDIFIGEVGKWQGWDPDPNSVEDPVYKEKELNELVKGYKDQKSRANEVYAERKQDSIKQAAQLEEKRRTGNSTRERLQAKLAKRKAEADAKTPAMVEIDRKEKTIVEERSRLNNNAQVIANTAAEINDIDAQMARIQELYAQMKK